MPEPRIARCVTMWERGFCDNKFVASKQYVDIYGRYSYHVRKAEEKDCWYGPFWTLEEALDYGKKTL